MECLDFTVNIVNSKCVCMYHGFSRHYHTLIHSFDHRETFSVQIVWPFIVVSESVMS